MSKNTLKTFFDEKELKPRIFSITHKGNVQMVESDFLINVIVNSTPEHEQRKILDIIVAIDFKNGYVNRFLEHLAKGLSRIIFNMRKPSIAPSVAS